METPSDRLKDLIAQMTIKSGNENISYNYFGYIFSRLRRVLDNSIPSIMGIAPRKDGTLVLLFNPSYFGGTSDEVLRKVIEHEGMHVLNKHISRLLRVIANEPNEDSKHAKIKLWNIASDCAVNPVISMPKSVIINGKPWEGCFPDLYDMKDGQPTEYYYLTLLEKAKQNSKQCKNCSKNKPDGDPSDEKNKSDGQGGEGEKEGCGNCPGKSLQGAGSEYDIIGDHSKWSDISHEIADVHALSRKIDGHIQNIIKDSVKNFKHRRGALPAHIQELINAALDPPKIPYYDLIKKMIKGSRHSKFKRSLTRINRKRTYAFIIDENNAPTISPFPGKTRDFTFKIVILIDTSGSMSIEDVREGLSGCKNIIEKDRHCKVTVLENDAKLQKEYVVKRVNDIDFQIAGRGGTNLREGILRAKQLNPDVMLVFTDGCCDNINDYSRKDLPKKIIWVVQKSGIVTNIDKTGYIVRVDDNG